MSKVNFLSSSFLLLGVEELGSQLFRRLRHEQRVDAHLQVVTVDDDERLVVCGGLVQQRSRQAQVVDRVHEDVALSPDLFEG